MNTPPDTPPNKRRRTRFRRAPKSRLGLWTALAVGVLIAAYAGVLELSRPHVSGERLSYGAFIRVGSEGRIQTARVLDEDAFVVGTYARADGQTAPYNTAVVRGSQEAVLENLVRWKVDEISVDPQVHKRIAALASILLPGLIITVLFVYLILSYRRGSGLFAVRSGARQLKGDGMPASFADVAGQDQAVTELREITEFLTDPDRFASLGARIPKGILLYGPPGCGKTLLARALAGEAGAEFFSISGSDFVELYVGVGASRVRELFKQARENSPAIVFIDELDSIGRARGSGGAGAAGNSEQEQALNQILAEMDGFSTAEGIVVVAATNRPDVLDPALLRPGRFDRSIGLERPNEADRLAVLRLHAEGKPLADGVDLADIASRAIGLTGADLAGVVNEAALLAARARRPSMDQSDFDAALQRLLETPERQRRLSLRERGVGRRSVGADRATFADVAGVDDAITELADIKAYLGDPDRFAALGARVPRGILLTGPPGCGKTLLARAMAGEANAAFLSLSGSELVEVFVGEGASRVRELFAEARTLAPAIVFVDEIDSIGARRGAGMEGNRERDQTLNQILVELDGFEARGGVIVMAATNRADILDPALVRPGRFDRQVAVSLPDRAGRLAILRLHAHDKPLAPDVDLDTVTGLTHGFSGADLANVLNEAALLAARAGLEQVPMALVIEGVDRALLGVASRGTVMSAEERRVVAYHEAGHALVALAVPGGRTPNKVSILPRGATLGHCAVGQDTDRVLWSRSALLDRIAVLLGGRAAEALVLGEPWSGSSSDIEQAAALARRMVWDLGMSDATGLWPGSGGGDRPALDSGGGADAEVRRLLEEGRSRAVAVLDGTRPALDQVATALLERETLSAAELEAIAWPVPAAGGPPGGPAARPSPIAQPPGG